MAAMTSSEKRQYFKHKMMHRGVTWTVYYDNDSV